MAKNWLLFAAAVCALAVPACEDNPDGFYKKAPDGAGDRWNDGKSTSVYDPNARNGFLDNYNATSKQELCSGPVKQQRWAKMMNEKIIPPRMIAGIDLAGSDAWTGLDFRDAERKLCQSKSLSGTETDLTASWGDADEVTVTYKLETNTITDYQLRQGFRGSLEFESRPYDLNDPAKLKPNPLGIHKYSVGVGRPVIRDGQTWELNWLKKDCAQGDCWDRQSVEMYDALMYTYAKQLQSTQGSCITAQTCLAKSWSDGTAVFGVRPLGIYFFIPQIALPQPAPSTPSYLYGFYVKLMPFSASEMFLKLDDEGPVATAPLIGDKVPASTCVQKLGTKYSDFLANCVNVFKDQKDNDFIKGKLVGGMGHNKEAFNFSIEGVNLDFNSETLGDFGTIGDDQMPAPNDTAREMEIDIRASGKVVNEFTKPVDANADGTCTAPLALNTAGKCDRQTLGGTGAIYREYTRRVQADIHAKMKAWLPPSAALPGSCATLAEDGKTCTACAKDGSTLFEGTCRKCDAGFKLEGGGCAFEGFPIGAAQCMVAQPPKGCTGFESFTSPASHVAGEFADENAGRVSIGPKATALGYKTVLKAGDPISAFCTDPSPNPGGKDIDPDGLQAVCTSDNDCMSTSCVANADAAQPKRCAPVTSKFYQSCDVGSLLDGSFTHVLNVLGNPHAPDKALSLPPALRDRKYYFKHWAAALVKYLKAANKYPVDLGRPEYSVDACDGFSCEPEPDHLLFDQIGETGDRDKFEYIDRRFVKGKTEPMKLEYQILINSSNQQEWKFHRKMSRAEEALYGALSEDRTLPLASPKDNVRITNVVGSPIIKAAGWTGVAGDPKRDAHYCASTLINGAPDPDCAMGPPVDSKTGAFLLDDYGQPLLKNYRGAFTGTVFAMGTHFMKLTETLPYIKSAKITLPFFTDPYSGGGASPTSAAAQTPTVLVDWRPETPADGIRIPVNSMRDKFIPSATVNFSGSSLDLDIDYEEMPDHTMKIQGVQSDNYMGNLFLCQDPGTGDILNVEQYESTDTIIGWLDAHPGTRDACSILTRWSASGVFPVMFAAKQAGMVLTVGVGSGVGRITSIEMYNTELQ